MEMIMRRLHRSVEVNAASFRPSLRYADPVKSADRTLLGDPAHAFRILDEEKRRQARERRQQMTNRITFMPSIGKPFAEMRRRQQQKLRAEASKRHRAYYEARQIYASIARTPTLFSKLTSSEIGVMVRNLANGSLTQNMRQSLAAAKANPFDMISSTNTVSTAADIRDAIKLEETKRQKKSLDKATEVSQGKKNEKVR